MRWPSQLLSLTLVLWPNRPDIQDSILSATRILKSVKRNFLTNVQIEFVAIPNAALGSASISQSDAPWDDCQLLEEVLLTFSKPHVRVVGDDKRVEAGRVEFWSLILGRTFPSLNKQGQLTFDFTYGKSCLNIIGTTFSGSSCSLLMV